jgi:FtsZ-binding cell division protein ZapB
MKTVIWIKTARVYAQDSDNTSKVERTTVKLEDGDNFKKFIRYANLKGYMKSEPPVIVKVMENKSMTAVPTWVEVDSQKWVDMLNEALKPVVNDGKVDHKLQAEQLKKENEQLKANNQAFEDRLKALEAMIAKKEDDKEDKTDLRTQLKEQANSLGLTYPKNISNDKLAELIAEAKK